MNPNYLRNRPEMASNEYKAWRLSVFSRDGFKCVLCESQKNLQAHHIVRFADNQQLRYLSNNGVTLCEEHHNEVTGKESQYAEQFRQYVDLKKREKALAMGKKVYKEKRKKWRARNPYRRY